MSCEVENGQNRVRVTGEMTINNAVALKDSLLAALSGRMERCAIDLSAVSEFDTTGLQTLLIGQRVCASRGVMFSVVDPSAVVREVLDLLQVRAFCVEFSECARA